jgi:hypothetical protein
MNWNVIATDSAVAVAAMSVAGVDQNTGDTIQANLGIGSYKVYHQFSLNRVELVDARRRGTNNIKRLFSHHIKAGLLTIRKKINNLIWTGTGIAADGGFVGFPVVLDPAVPYANIDPVAYPNWVPILDTSGANRALTRKILYDFHRVLQLEEVMYNTIVTSPLTSQVYNELFDTIAGNYQISGVTTRSAVDLAPGERHYDGVPIKTDKDCPVGQIVTFDSSCVELMSFDLADADAGQLASFGLKDNFNTIASAEVGGLRINVALLPQTNPGTLTFQMFTIPQMKVENRRMVQAIRALL